MLICPPKGIPHISIVCQTTLCGAQLFQCRTLCGTVCGIWQETPQALCSSTYLCRHQHHKNEQNIYLVPKSINPTVLGPEAYSLRGTLTYSSFHNETVSVHCESSPYMVLHTCTSSFKLPTHLPPCWSPRSPVCSH